MYVSTLNDNIHNLYCVFVFQDTRPFYQIKLIHCSYLGDEVHFRFLNKDIQNDVQTIASHKWLIIVITFDNFPRNILNHKLFCIYVGNHKQTIWKT